MKSSLQVIFKHRPVNISKKTTIQIINLKCPITSSKMHVVIGKKKKVLMKLSLLFTLITNNYNNLNVVVFNKRLLNLNYP